jgi:hypothetical protein
MTLMISNQVIYSTCYHIALLLYRPNLMSKGFRDHAFKRKNGVLNVTSAGKP